MSNSFSIEPCKSAVTHIAAAICLALASLSSQAAILVNGQVKDWSAVPVLATATGQGVSALKVTIESGYLLVQVQGQAMTANYNLFIDTDGKASTGHQSYLWPRASGADFLLSNGALYRSTGPGWSWVAAAGDVQAVASADATEIKIALSALGALGVIGDGKVTGNTNISVGFQALSASWQTSGNLPNTGTFAPYAAAPAPFAVGKGLIIPAYVGLDDAYSWNILKEGAAAMTLGKNPAFRDYWVAVNSGTNGPFTSAADWLKASSVWNPIRSNGGRIFGYVHTCVEPVGPHLRDLATVQAEIAAWVNGYPEMDGIWLDEYYPRFEIAAADGVVGPTYPNGLANAPTDRGFVNSSNQFNGQQVNPAGGYYDQLIKWIHATYPKLRIIGNAGGAFYSNQLNYGDLPDVLVSFEQNFDIASNAPTQDWSTLNRQVPGSKSGQLALIHRNTGGLSAAIDQALARGYTHVYTTNRMLEDNVWGGLPPYLSSEIQYLADHP